MGSEWREVTLGEVFQLQRGYDITKKQQISGTIPVVSSGGISSYHNAAMASAPGVIVGRKGSLGTTFYIDTDYWPHDTTLWVKDFKGNHPKFIYYHLVNLSHTLLKMDVGAANPTLNRNHVHALPTNWPPLPEQRSIAHVLGTLDDKIDLLRRQNETLESMARALFKAWFVDFEPVRAKAEGRWQRGQSLPGLPAELWELFPDKLVDSELGEVPEGWGISTIGNEVSVHGGSTPSTKNPEFWSGGHYHWATPKDLSPLQFPVLLDTDRKITDAGLSKISSGLLPEGTVLLSSRAPIGYLAIAEIPTAINQGFIAMKCNGVLSKHYVLAWCRESMDLILGNANGSTFQEISKTNFRPIPVIVPPIPILNHYNSTAEALYLRLVQNQKESRSLAQLRDTLLPVLVSGEVRVGGGE